MEEKKRKKLVGYIQDKEIAVFDELTDIADSLEKITESLDGVRLSELDQLKGEPGEDGIGIDGLDGISGSVFLGAFDSVEELPDDANEGDWALVDGDVWRA